MTTAQDQQSRAEFEAWYIARLRKSVPNLAGWPDDAIRKGLMGLRIDGTYTGVMQIDWETWQAARTLPAPENVREGEPYDNPAFEDLARTMGVWGTAQAALCAQFFLAGRGAVPATSSVSNARSGARWKCGNEFLPYHPSASHVEPAYRDGWNACFKASAQVQAMGRVPPGWKAIAEICAQMCQKRADSLAVSNQLSAATEANKCAIMLRGPNDYWREQLDAAAPRPPAAQEGKTVACACGDEFPVDSYGAGFLDAKGVCFGCDAAETATHPTGD